MNYKHTSPSIHYYFLVPQSANIIYIQTNHPKTSASSTKPFIKYIPPWSCHFIKTIPVTKYNGNIYTYLGAPLFQKSVSVFRNLVWCDIAWNMVWHTTPHYIQTAKLYVCFSGFSRAHMTPNSLPFQWTGFAVPVSYIKSSSSSSSLSLPPPPFF
jgi:hypothetical protein